MEFIFLSTENIIAIHDNILNPEELPGLAGGKSLEGALSRIEFRVRYGLINDEFDLAAMYAVALAQGHVFNDGNKRTAYAAMETILHLHGFTVMFEYEDVGDLIIQVAQGHADEQELAKWLRGKENVGSE